MLATTLVLFVLDRWRYDVVALLAALTEMVGGASAFMNNVGALALFPPVAVRPARTSGVSASALLMPLAFASPLRGMITLIGTPPNIIIASIRGDEIGDPFGMFDFAPVGLALTLIGIAFISLVGWRLVPTRKGSDGEWLELVGEGSLEQEALSSDEVSLLEVIIRPGVPIVGRTARTLPFALRAALKLLAVSRGGGHATRRAAWRRPLRGRGHPPAPGPHGGSPGTSDGDGLPSPRGTGAEGGAAALDRAGGDPLRDGVSTRAHELMSGAVIVHTTSVSTKGSMRATDPSESGSLVSAAACRVAGRRGP